MAVETIDMSLEEIIKQTRASKAPRRLQTGGVDKTGKRQTGGGGRGGTNAAKKAGTARTTPKKIAGKPRDPLRRTKTGGVNKQNVATQRAVAPFRAQKQETKLIISNLHPSVVDSDIQVRK